MSEFSFFTIRVSGPRLVIVTHGRAPQITWRIRTLSSLKIIARYSASRPRRAFTFTAWTFGWYLSVSLCLRFRCGRGRLFFSSPRASVFRCGFVTETRWISFRTLSIRFPLIAFSHSPLSVGFPPFVTLGYCTTFKPFRSKLWNFLSSLLNQYIALPLSSVWNSSAVYCFEYFSCSYMANTVWSWTESCNFNLHKPSRIISVGISFAVNGHDPILHRNPEHRHCVSVFWTNLTGPVQLHKLQWLENAHRSCMQFASLLRIGRICERVALRHFAFRKCTCVRIFFNADAIIASSIS